MLDHVIVPLDGSEVAERAVSYARKVVNPKGGRITLLTAIDVPDYTVMSYYPAVVGYETNRDDMVEKAVPPAKEYLTNISDRLQAEGFNVSVDAIIGEAASTIVEQAEELKVDAIVMSTHGRSGISRWLFGSVANKVLTTTNIPVFIVPVRQ